MTTRHEFVWHTHLLSIKEIMENPKSCLWGTCLPSVLFARNVMRLADGRDSFLRAAFTHLAMGGCCCWCFCLSCYAASFREKLRRRRNLPMEPYSDIHTHMFCHPCALCQEERELDSMIPPGVPVPPEPTIDRNPSEAKQHIEAVRSEMMDRS